MFEKLEGLYLELREINYNDFEKRKLKYIQIENHVKKMAENIVQVRLKQNDIKPLVSSEECCGLLKLSKDCYNANTGIRLTTENQFL